MLGKGEAPRRKEGGTSKVDTAGVKEGELRALRGTLMHRDFERKGIHQRGFLSCLLTMVYVYGPVSLWSLPHSLLKKGCIANSFMCKWIFLRIMKGAKDELCVCVDARAKNSRTERASKSMELLKFKLRFPRGKEGSG